MSPYNILSLTNRQWLAVMELTASDLGEFEKKDGELIFELTEDLFDLPSWEPLTVSQIAALTEPHLAAIALKEAIRLPDVSSMTWIMIARMVAEGSLFMSHYCDLSKKHDSIAAPILLNDVFYWACSDARSTTFSEIPMLYALWCAHPLNIIRFASEERGQAPQDPYLEWMREQGYATDWAARYLTKNEAPV